MMDGDAFGKAALAGGGIGDAIKAMSEAMKTGVGGGGGGNNLSQLVAVLNTNAVKKAEATNRENDSENSTNTLPYSSSISCLMALTNLGCRAISRSQCFPPLMQIILARAAPSVWALVTAAMTTLAFP